MKLRGGRWLSATQVARACAVDHKTIRNWVGKGKLRAERTEGGHLRFWPLDVVEFLRTFELGVPEGLRHVRLTAVVLYGDEERLTAARRALGRRYEIATARHVVDALVAVATLRADVLVAGDTRPLDIETLRDRLGSLQATRHTRVVDDPGDAAHLRDTLERLSAN